MRKIKLGYEFFIAKRYLKSKRKTGFISLITYISMAGVMVGVAALIIVLSVMNGFESEVRSRFVNFEAHLRLTTQHDEGVNDVESVMARIRDIPHIVAMSPFILNKGIIRTKQNTEGIYLKGIDPGLAEKVTAIRSSINYGELDLGMQKTEDGKELPGIILGFNLADKIYANVGDVVTIISPVGIPGLGGYMQLKEFIVTAYFETGLYDFDDVYGYTSIESAQKLYRMGKKVSGIEFKLDDMKHAPLVAQEIHTRLNDDQYRTQTWFEMRRNLFSWMQIEKWAAFIILSLIIVVAAFNIISTLIMVVMEKTKDIGILKSMGATAKSIKLIFIFEGLFAGIIGTILGSVIGYSLCWSQLQYKWFSLPTDIYIIDALPVVINWPDIVFINIAAIMLSFLATVYPASRAASLDPVESIRYE